MDLHRPGPADHLHAYGFGAVGHGLPTAIGAAIAANRPVVLVEGDGSLLMHVGELSTVAKENLDLLVLVMNDGGFGSEIHKLNFKGADGELARFGRDDFAGDRPRLRHRRAHARRPGRGRRPRRRATSTAAARPSIDVPMSRAAISAPDPARALPRHRSPQGGMTDGLRRPPRPLRRRTRRGRNRPLLRPAVGRPRVPDRLAPPAAVVRQLRARAPVGRRRVLPARARSRRPGAQGAGRLQVRRGRERRGDRDRLPRRRAGALRRRDRAPRRRHARRPLGADVGLVERPHPARARRTPSSSTPTT